MGASGAYFDFNSVVPSGSEHSTGDNSLEDHPARKILITLLAYGASKDILSMNCFEVLRFSQEIESGRFGEMAMDPKRRMEYHDFENHLIRYLHNFLAAAKTLVDHTRNMMRSEIISVAHLEAYQKQVELSFSDGLTRFIGDFRNYTLHYGIPHTVHSVSIPEEKWQVGIDLGKIKGWSGWTPKSREFIALQPEVIRLIWLVGSYQKKAMEFNTWLTQSFVTFYGDVMQDFDARRQRTAGK
jgi:hypothetical protein